MNAKLYSVKEISKILKLNRSTIERAIHSGKINAISIGQGKKNIFRISENELNRILNVKPEKEYNESIKNKILSTILINENGCWEWQGYKVHPKKLYGSISYHNRPMLVHRLSYILWRGDIKDTDICMHLCNNPGCVNPDHLCIGNQKLNLLHMKLSGRENKVKGEKNHKSKTNYDEVEKMRELYRTGYTMRQIGKLFNLQSSTVCYIINKKTWKLVC